MLWTFVLVLLFYLLLDKRGASSRFFTRVPEDDKSKLKGMSPRMGIPVSEAHTWKRCTSGESLVSQRSFRSSLISLDLRTAGLSPRPAPSASSRLNSGELPY